MSKTIREKRPWTMYAAVIATVLVSGMLRFLGQGFDHWRPVLFAEQMVGFITAGLTFPQDIQQYFDTFFSPLNPYLLDIDLNYPMYGSFYAALLKFAAGAIDGRDPQIFLETGRALAASFSFISIFFVFAIGRNLHGSEAGFIGAMLWALSPISLQQAHLALPLSLFTLLGLILLYTSLNIVRAGSLRDHLLFGVIAALALSIDPRGIMYLAVFFLAVCGLWIGIAKRPKALQSERLQTFSKLGVSLVYCAFTLLLFIVVFRLVEPYAFGAFKLLELNPAFLHAWHQAYFEPAYALYNGDFISPSAIWSQLSVFLLYWSATPFVTVFAVAGFTWLVIKRSAEALVIIGCLMVFLLSIFSIRMFDPLLVSPFVPLLVICAGVGVAQILAWTKKLVDGCVPDSAEEKRQRRFHMAAVSLTLVLLSLSVAWGFAFAGIYKSESPRYQASYWMADNVPKSSVIMTEQGDVRLPAALGDREIGPYRYSELAVLEPDSLEKAEGLLSTLRAAEYIVISSNRGLWRVFQDPQNYRHTIRFYELLFGGKLGYTLEKSFFAYPRLGHWRMVTDTAHPAFTFRERPMIFIFHKDRRLSLEQFTKLLPYPPPESNLAEGTSLTYKDLLKQVRLAEETRS